MKFSASMILATLGGASAFVAPSKTSFNTAVRMSEEIPSEASPEVAAEEPVAVAASLPSMSAALPFMARPAVLDGSMAGDVGFDPLGFAKDEASLMKYREAEIRHARIAMLAAAGWPLSELFNAKLSNTFGLNPLVDASDRAPSVLNGGLGKVPLAYWAVVVLGTAGIEAYGMAKAKSNDPEYFPGNLGFDPLVLYPKDKEGQLRMQLTEVKNGRLAMIAITAFAFQEFVSKLGVVDETPAFFKPLPTVMHEYANSGYIMH